MFLNLKKSFRPLFLGLFCAGLTPLGLARDVSILDFGATGDGEVINTQHIQKAIDTLAEDGGGTIVVPEGVFMSGALFFKAGVDLRLEKGAVLRCPTDMKHFPEQRTRIEGHFEESFNPALINVDGCDGFQLTGEGTLDGAGFPIWELYWKMREESKSGFEFKNLDVPRARLALIENSKNVKVSGVTFKDSQFWNLHLYNCDGVVVENARFVVPDDYKQAPSSDGVDIDSSRNVTVKGCYFSVTDDCVALKGSKGPLAMEDKDSPPVENIRILDCMFKRGHHAVTNGSEATIIRNVVVERCVVKGEMPLYRGKLRPDTPQLYENLRFKDITFESDTATIFQIAPWTQYYDLQGHEPPSSIVRNITVSGVKGNLKSFGIIQGNELTDISNIAIKNVDVTASKMGFKVSDKVKDLLLENIKVNGENYER